MWFVTKKTKNKTQLSGDFYGYKGDCLSRKRLGFIDRDGDPAERVTIEVTKDELKNLSYFDGENFYYQGVLTDHTTGQPIQPAL